MKEEDLKKGSRGKRKLGINKWLFCCALTGDRTLSIGHSRKKESPYENVGENAVVIGMFYIFLFAYVYSLGKQLGK